MDQFDTTAAEVVAFSERLVDDMTALAAVHAFSFLGAVLLLIGGWFIAGLIERWVYRGLQRFRAIDETLRRFFSKTLRYAVLIIVGVVVLGQFGVQTASIIAVLGAAGLAIGLALQGTLQNIAAGIMLLVLRPFRVGEAITAGAISGTVEEIGLFATELKSADGVYVFAPNSLLWNAAVTNFSRNPLRRAEITIGISYSDDIGLARRTLEEVARADERVLEEPAPTTFVGALADDAVDVTLAYWTANTDHGQTRLDLTQAAKHAFDSSGLTIPSLQGLRLVGTGQG